MINLTNPKFQLGTLVLCPGALQALCKANQSPWLLITRHVKGDWGEELCVEDRLLNDQALKDGSRILSAYQTATGEKIWIITSATDENGKRAYTTILLPDEY